MAQKTVDEEKLKSGGLITNPEGEDEVNMLILPDMTTHLAYDILTNPDNYLTVHTLPFRPKAGTTYLVIPQTPKEKDDWRQDGHRWVNNAVSSLPKKKPIVKKSYFKIAEESNGKIVGNGEFTKFSYKLLDADTPILIQYLGDDDLSCLSAHGNAKDKTQTFIPTKKSVLNNLKQKAETQDSRKLYKQEVASNINKLPSELPRNNKQIENLKYNTKSSGRYTRDGLFNLHELALDGDDFVWHIQTHPDLEVVCGLSSALEEASKVMGLRDPASIASYDTTFKMGDFYISAFIMKHAAFKEKPIFPVMFLIHERKLQDTHERFFQILKQKLKFPRGNYKLPICTDEEYGIVNAIDKVVSDQVRRYGCWNHLRKDMKDWVKKHAGKPDDYKVYWNNTRRLLECDDEEDFQEMYDEMKKKWSQAFLLYFDEKVKAQLDIFSKWAIEEAAIFNPYSGITSNDAESFNALMKRFQQWKEAPVDVIVLAFKMLQKYYLMEFQRGFCGLGNYHLINSSLKQDIPEDIEVNACPPDQIVDSLENGSYDALEFNHAKDGEEKGIITSRCTRATEIIKSDHISFSSKLGRFTVMDWNKGTFVVTLGQSEKCTCHVSPNCYHIMAVKMSIGLDVVVPKKKAYNLTQLRVNARPRKGTKTGRKQPLPGDLDVAAAPDAIQVDADEDLSTEADEPSNGPAKVDEPSNATSEEHLVSEEPSNDVEGQLAHEAPPNVIIDSPSDTTIPYVVSETDLLNVSARHKVIGSASMFDLLSPAKETITISRVPSVISVNSVDSLERDIAYNLEVWVFHDGQKLLTNLNEDSKEILMSDEWLTSDIIDSSMEILKFQFPEQHGLQSCLYASQLHKAYPTVLTPFIQIFNRSPVDEGNHWVLATNNVHCQSNEVCIYDSGFSDLPFAEQCILTGLLKAGNGDQITGKMMNVVRQKNLFDCGVYSIAYATSILFGIDPISVIFTERSMRRHLIKCVEAKEFCPFPSKSRNSQNLKKPVKKTVTFLVCCSCQTPECGFLFQCDGCDKWYHPECEGLTKQYVQQHEESFCNIKACQKLSKVDPKKRK